MSNTNDANVETVLNKINITEAKATMMLTVLAPPTYKAALHHLMMSSSSASIS
jgi:hypothetical protein